MKMQWLKQVVVHEKNQRAYYCIADWIEPQLKFNRKELDLFIDGVEPYKHDQTTTVAKVVVGECELVLKRYNPRSFTHKIKRALRQSRADRCWQMSYAFARAGLNVATPAFMYEERFFFIRKYAYFANQHLVGDELLQALPNMEKEDQLRVVEAFKGAMQIMQQYKITHGDMKASNLLWVNNQLFFIDLDGARQHNSMLSWKRSNKRDRKRFLKNWREFPELEALFSWLK